MFNISSAAVYGNCRRVRMYSIALTDVTVQFASPGFWETGQPAAERWNIPFPWFYQAISRPPAAAELTASCSLCPPLIQATPAAGKRQPVTGPRADFP